MAETNFVDIISILGQLAGNVLATSDLPRERAIGALVAGSSQIPNLLQQHAIKRQLQDVMRQETAGRQQAMRAVNARLSEPIPVTPRPVTIPLSGGQTGSAVLDMPATRLPTPAERTSRIGNMLNNPGGAVILERAGHPVRAGQAAARAKREAAQQLRHGKLSLLKEIRGQRLPQGTRTVISQAKTMQDLIDASAAIQAGLSINNATPAKLAYAAAGVGPEAERARKALKLMTPGEARATIAQLARKAATGDHIAAKAIQIIKDLRSTGVGKRKQAIDIGELPPPILPPPLKTLPGGGVQGIARPRVKSFRRLP